LLHIAMHSKLPQYTKSDLAIMLFIVVPWILILNWLIIGPLYFHSIGIFLTATLLTFLMMGASWQVHTWIAVTLRDRFPREEQTTMRLLFAIPLFILVTALLTTLFFWGYSAVHFPGVDFNSGRYQTALVIGAVVNVFTTFVHEGIVRFERWKTVLIENEQLKKEYMQSQLLGLKSQINPHFLFNSLNSLSSLINDDEQEAELFLNEMSKVYRYLLRNNDEELVPLHTELDFVRSYFYLLKTRLGRAIELCVSVDADAAEKQLPPLTLQMLLEDVLNCNTCSRDQPISIQITTKGDLLELRNTIHRKRSDENDTSESFENMKNKFWLLCQRRVEIDETEAERLIRIPLITEKRGKAA